MIFPEAKQAEIPWNSTTVLASSNFNAAFDSS